MLARPDALPALLAPRIRVSAASPSALVAWEAPALADRADVADTTRAYVDVDQEYAGESAAATSYPLTAVQAEALAAQASQGSLGLVAVAAVAVVLLHAVYSVKNRGYILWF